MIDYERDNRWIKIHLKDFTVFDMAASLKPKILSLDGICGFALSLRDDYLPSAFYEFRTYKVHRQAAMGKHKKKFQ